MAEWPIAILAIVAFAEFVFIMKNKDKLFKK